MENFNNSKLTIVNSKLGKALLFTSSTTLANIADTINEIKTYGSCTGATSARPNATSTVVTGTYLSLIAPKGYYDGTAKVECLLTTAANLAGGGDLTTIYNQCVSCGVTPSSKTVSAICDAIEKIQLLSQTRVSGAYSCAQSVTSLKSATLKLKTNKKIKKVRYSVSVPPSANGSLTNCIVGNAGTKSNCNANATLDSGDISQLDEVSCTVKYAGRGNSSFSSTITVRASIIAIE